MWNGLLTTFPQSTEWEGEAVSLFSPGLTQSQHKDFYIIHIPYCSKKVRGTQIKVHKACLCYSHSNSNTGL